MVWMGWGGEKESKEKEIERDDRRQGKEKERIK